MEINKVPQGNWWTISVVSIVVGFFAFLMVVGPRVLQPTNIAWLGSGDPATHYLGWLFFRNSEWSFPLGLNPKYGLEIGNAILFSDSSPLLALFFKPVAQYLPATFQYSGMWLLICFVLQAWFAFKLISLITKDTLVLSLATCFFVFAPPMILRLSGHLNLAGHFLVLASLYLALLPSPQRRIVSWTILLVSTALVHAYLLFMVGLIWGADMVGRLVNRSLSFRRTVLELSIALGATSLACWQAGYFSVGGGVSSEGYGFFRMNLLSIFDSDGWSYLLPDIPGGRGDYEGFNYLGLGMILLGICVLPSLFNFKGVVRSITKRPVLLIAMLGLTVLALSNKLGIASVSLKVGLPDFAMRVLNIFRSSGRMFWPVFYLIYFSIIFLVVRRHSKRAVLILLGVALVVQITDTSKVWLDIRAKLMATPSSTWQTKMVDPFWNEAATKYSKVRWIMPDNCTTNWQAIASYAGTYGLATDAVYLARVSNTALEVLQQRAMDALLSGEFDSDSLYLLEDRYLLQVAASLNTQKDILAKVDGFIVVAPGWKECTSCSNVSGELNVSDQLPAPLGVGDQLLFHDQEQGVRYLGLGWSDPEHWGTWSDSDDAFIVLPLRTERATAILVETTPLLNQVYPEQVVGIKMNGLEIDPVTLTADSGGRFRVDIPPEVKAELRWNRVVTLQFHFSSAARQIDMGRNTDSREPAIGLVSLTIQ